MNYMIFYSQTFYFFRENKGIRSGDLVWKKKYVKDCGVGN